MPVRNGANYFRAAMDSIFKQTYADFEFIVVDDVSTDNLAFIVESCNDARLRFDRFEQPVGICRTLNRGIDLATGRYIARMDADDVCMPSRFERQVTCLDRYPDVGVCGSCVQKYKTVFDNLLKV